MEVYIPTHISISVGESLLRSIVCDLETTEKGKAILGNFGTSTLRKSEDMKRITLHSLLDSILPVESDDDSDGDDSDGDDSD